MSPEFWNGCYVDEGEYPIKYAGTKAYDADSDGDGILDGADDQDFDDLPNIMELSRNMAGNWPIGRAACDPGRTPYDPAIPTRGAGEPVQPVPAGPLSRTCQRHPVIGAGYAPYDAGLEAVRAQLGRAFEGPLRAGPRHFGAQLAGRR